MTVLLLCVVSAINCTEPKTIQNSTLSDNGTSFGVVNTYTCAQGYVLPGSNRTSFRVACQADGTWVSVDQDVAYSTTTGCECEQSLEKRL